jgi:hypothetical protein
MTLATTLAILLVLAAFAATFGHLFFFGSGYGFAVDFNDQNLAIIRRQRTSAQEGIARTSQTLHPRFNR